jgi:hypothetical protein
MVTLIVTAYGASSLGEEAREAGARHILPKPLDLPTLLSLIQAVVPSSN